MSSNQETFPFPGIDPAAHERLKVVEEEYPGFATPIDVLVQRFRSEGIKVGIGKDPGNVFILPAQSTDIENDSIFPRDLQISDSMDERIKKLILINRDLK